MKISFKKSFCIDGKEFKIKKKGQLGADEAPSSFLLNFLFINLVIVKAVQILSFDSKDQKELEQLAEKLGVEELHPAINEQLEKFEEKEETKDEENSDSDNDSDSLDDSNKESSEGEGQVQDGEKLSEESNDSKKSEEVKGDEEKKSEEPKQLSKEEKEFEFLHDKAKRLNNKEKARYEQLKKKLGKS